LTRCSCAWAAAGSCRARRWPRGPCRPPQALRRGAPLRATTANRPGAPGAIARIDTTKTIADGAQTQHLGQIISFAIIRRDVVDILMVTDEPLVDGMRIFAERMQPVVEPMDARCCAAEGNSMPYAPYLGNFSASSAC